MKHFIKDNAYLFSRYKLIPIMCSSYYQCSVWPGEMSASLPKTAWVSSMEEVMYEFRQCLTLANMEEHCAPHISGVAFGPREEIGKRFRFYLDYCLSTLTSQLKLSNTISHSLFHLKYSVCSFGYSKMWNKALFL